VQLDVGVSGAGDLRFLVDDGSDPNTQLDYLDINDNNWHHVIVSRTSSTDTWNLYVDSVLRDTDTSTDSSVDADIVSSIGGRSIVSPIDRSFNGSIDEVLIYNKSLSASEIKDLYKAGLSQNSNTNITLEIRTATSYNISDVNLTGFWSFNAGNATDDSGNGNVGTVTGATFGYENGTVGQGAYFDGVDDRIDVGTGLDNIFDNGGTFSAWINPASDGGNNLGYIYTSYMAAAPAGWNFNVNSESGGFVRTTLYLHTSSTAGQFASSVVIPINKWTHVTVTYDAITPTTKPIFYFNGKNVTVNITVTPTGTRTSDAANIKSIGNRDDNLRDFDGAIDEVRIYNRSLSAAEIQNLYELGDHHILWSDWENQGLVSDNTPITTSAGGNFMQYKANLDTDNPDVSPYILNHTGIGTSLEASCPAWAPTYGPDYCFLNTTYNPSNGETLSHIGNVIMGSGGSIANSNAITFTINVTGSLTIESGGNIDGDGANCASGTCNSGCNVDIHANTLVLDRTAYIYTRGGTMTNSGTNYYGGLGGNININATNLYLNGSINTDGGDGTGTAYSSGKDAGDITINTTTLIVNGSGSVYARGGKGQGCNYGGEGIEVMEEQ